MDDLLLGITTMGYAISGLFFLSFWSQSKDRLFLLFAIAFWVLGLQSLLSSLLNISTEDATILFIVRLAAFLIILYGIIDKNYPHFIKRGKATQSKAL